MAAHRTLHIDLKTGECISLDGGRVILSLVRKSGQLARLKFTAAPDVTIDPVRESAIGAAQDNVILLTQ